MKLYMYKTVWSRAALACGLMCATLLPLHAVTYQVTSTADALTPPVGTLRWAIQQVNAGAGTGDTISFNIATSDPGYDSATNTWTIQPVQDLDSITQQVTIDGYTQPGSAVNTRAQGDSAVLTIVLNGNNYTTGDGYVTGNGLHFAPLANTSVDGSIVRGLVINQWLASGILLDASNANISNVQILGCFIGTDASGTLVMANRTGVGLAGAINTYCTNVQIGTPLCADRNLIAGSFGWDVDDSYSVGGGCINSLFNVGTLIQNNYIGVDRTGTVSLGTSQVGLHLRLDFDDIVGGSNDFERNLISGQSMVGIRLRNSVQTTIQGNYIGTDVTGTKPLGNANKGIILLGAGSNSLISNVISGNGSGISLGDVKTPGSTLNVVQCNLIGTDVSGSRALANNYYGIEVNDGQNTIGGTSGQQNVISGNRAGGILLYGTPNTTGNLITANYIGTDCTGTQPLPNGGNGIQIGLNGALGGALGNSIGLSDENQSQPVTREQLISMVKESAFERRHRKSKPRKASDSGVQKQSPTLYSPRASWPTNAIPAQTLGLNFEAATVSNTVQPFDARGDQNLTGSVGPQQYIMFSYSVIRSFDKATGKPDGVLNIDGSSFLGASIGDPRITYSRFLDRWILSAENMNIGYPSELIIAWSDSGVITSETVWTVVTFTNEQLVPQNIPADGPAPLDYQQLATDVNAVYISMDTFDATTGAFLGTSTLVIPNSAIITGNTSPAFTVIPGILANISAFTPPADNFDPDAEFGYLINAVAFEYPCLPNIVPFCPPPSTPTECCTYNQLFFYRILNPGSAQPTLGQQILLDVPNYTDPANAPHAGNLYTTLELPPGNVNAMYLQTSSSALKAPHVRNKQLYVCHNIQVDSTGTGNPAGDRVGVRWYQFDLTGDPTGNGCGIETETTCPALVQWGTVFDTAITDNPKFYYIPAIMTNKNGDLVIEGTVSGNNDYTNVFYAGRKASDPLGTLRDPVLITNNTSNPYNVGPLNAYLNANIGQRWGDLSSLAPDPSNDLIIWSTGEWAAVVNGWGIQATQLLPAS